MAGNCDATGVYKEYSAVSSTRVDAGYGAEQKANRLQVLNDNRGGLEMLFGHRSVAQAPDYIVILHLSPRLRPTSLWNWNTAKGWGTQTQSWLARGQGTRILQFLCLPAISHSN